VPADSLVGGRRLGLMAAICRSGDISDVYAYTGNDPLNRTDPLGLCDSAQCGNANPSNSLIQQTNQLGADLQLGTQAGLGGANQAASSGGFQQAQWFVPLLEVPPVEQLTPLDQLPPGAAGGPRSGMDFPRNLGKPQGDDPYPPCTYCGEDTGPGNLHRDHIIPKSQGGNGSEDNLAPSCPSCNLSKGPQTPQQWYDWLQNR